MSARKLNRYEARERNKEIKEFHLKGEGVYLFRNNSSGTLNLPKPANNGVRVVAKNAEWEGDNYFMFLVQKNDARLVRTITSPEEQKEEIKMAEKLLVDQPDQVTVEGTLEHVVLSTDGKNKKLNEGQPVDDKDKDEAEALINEDPLDGIQILIN